MEKLYHYTSVGGFEGMISNNSIRMTKSDFLNDPADCHLFVTLVEKYIDTHPNVLSKSISNLGSHKHEVEELYKKRGCDLIHYIEYIHKHIALYVMSMTQIDDGMNMWNYYGQGGMELEFSKESLVESLKKTFVSEKEFLTESKVIYTNSEFDVEKIVVPDFSKFVLINKKSNNIFEDHRSFIKKNSQYEADQLYAISCLNKFIDTYIRSYVSTLKYLFEKGIIDINTLPDVVFEEVFKNVSNLNDFYYWKHDLSLYMLVLSALIKSDSYEYEKEHRIVYFEYNVNSDKKKKEEYTIKNIASGNFICPYITFQKPDLLQESLEGITISPVTRNLPINSDKYMETLKKYLLSNGFCNDIDITFSQHTIRW